ncbi:serine hydrolase domain-containing protein [Dyella sp. EPa41]|uniref:serine hydrolase domain-containing protein n=1 Tax=Dyella sp. EPa41 TaxID=1561194 RepID=UPI00191562DC|nr:serine hydrolase domain-containing protein [Dyella sp. EPa41]
MRCRHVAMLLCLSLAANALAADAPPQRLRGEALDRKVEQLMHAAHVPGLALALIENGQVTYLHAYGERDTAKHLPLTTDTVMYAASITKAAFSYAVMTLADAHKLELDTPIAGMLSRPLPEYARYADLAGDDRWRRITPRMLLSHGAGFPNFRFFTPTGYDAKGKLYIAFDPGSRFAYSGEGINLLQFVLENAKNVDVATLMQRALFDRFGMSRTSMTWRADFADNLAIGYDEAGKALGHKQRESVRAAGSMDTTPHDYAQLLAGMVRGDGLSAATHADWLRPVQRIRSVQQFPTLDTSTTTDNEGIALSSASGVIVYRSPQGPAWFKTGHDDGTNNLVLCLQGPRDCVMILSNSSNAEGIYRYLLDITLGPTCYPWYWESDIPYDHPSWSRPESRQSPHPPCTPLPFPRQGVSP